MGASSIANLKPLAITTFIKKFSSTKNFLCGTRTNDPLERTFYYVSHKKLLFSCPSSAGIYITIGTYADVLTGTLPAITTNVVYSRKKTLNDLIKIIDLDSWIFKPAIKEFYHRRGELTGSYEKLIGKH